MSILPARVFTFRALMVAGALSSLACSPKTSVRMVDDPAGEAIEYGAPKQVRYDVDFAASRQMLRVIVYQAARCDVIPVTVMQRYQETLHGDEVVQRSPVTKKQVAGEPKGDIACDQTYARNVEVFLDVAGNRVSLGETDPTGQVEGDLAKLLKVGGYEKAGTQAKLILRPNRGKPLVEVATVDLSELTRYDERVAELVSQLEAILAKGVTGASPAEITRSYELYTQLRDIASSDPRVDAVAGRFWELYTGRKQEEARERLGRNLEALSKAKETLKVMGDAAIPLYVQAAVNSGMLDQRSLEWASLRLIRALRSSQAVCAAGFTFGGVPSYGWPADARLAAEYVNYGYGPSVQGSFATVCAR